MSLQHTVFVVALMAAVNFALAQGAAVERAQHIRSGTWREGPGGAVEFDQATNVVKARLGALFGTEWRAQGRPAESLATVKIRWNYPEPGMAHPVTRALRTFDEFDYDVTLGARTITYLELHSDYMLLPGKWSLEVREGSRTLLRHEFTLVR